ncbi:hypothetical protein ACJBU6_08566 [Exserohilum turcicum]
MYDVINNLITHISFMTVLMNVLFWRQLRRLYVTINLEAIQGGRLANLMARFLGKLLLSVGTSRPAELDRRRSNVDTELYTRARPIKVDGQFQEHRKHYPSVVVFKIPDM